MSGKGLNSTLHLGGETEQRSFSSGAVSLANAGEAVVFFNLEN